MQGPSPQPFPPSAINPRDAQGAAPADISSTATSPSCLGALGKGMSRGTERGPTPWPGWVLHAAHLLKSVGAEGKALPGNPSHASPAGVLPAVWGSGAAEGALPKSLGTGFTPGTAGAFWLRDMAQGGRQGYSGCKSRWKQNR